ncbi:hypothetical protein ACWD5R_04980 [Streptomyces sp. NPDC002514]|uniref:hypothetical protein n=1 Tax=Streptomyces sp. NPDC001270 TaxID=3364554 RepID=UPI00368B9F89
MPPQNDDQQRSAERLAEQRAAITHALDVHRVDHPTATTQDPPEGQRAIDGAAIMQYALNLQERARQEAAARLVHAEIEWSPSGYIAALDVYAAHQQMNPQWPTMPPPGLKVAVHPASLGREGEVPVMVTLDIPQPQIPEPGRVQPPRFLAGPRLDLDDASVHMAIRTTGVDQLSYQQAQSLRGPDLPSRYDGVVSAREERFFRQAQPTPPAQPHNPYAADANRYLPTASSPAGGVYPSPTTPQPASGPAWQPFLNNSPAAPANRAPGRR